jgi:hypothetical protein
MLDAIIPLDEEEYGWSARIALAIMMPTQITAVLAVCACCVG